MDKGEIKPLAISYSRWSSDAQTGNDSYRRQRAKFLRFCEKFGYEPFEEEFVDKGKSAWKGKHLEEGADLYEFKKRAQAGGFKKGSMLVVEKFDRLSRGTIDEQEDNLRDILKSGISVAVLTSEKKPDIFYHHGHPDALQGMDRVVQILGALVAMLKGHQESLDKSERIREKKNKNVELARKGKKLGGRAPSWITVNRDANGVVSYSCSKEARETLNLIFDLAIEKNYGSKKIIAELNKRGIPSFSKKGDGKWLHKQAKDILFNRAVTGFWQPMTKEPNQPKRKFGEPILDYYPEVISKEKFDRAQLVAQKRKISPRCTGRAVHEVQNVLISLVNCLCGSAMHMYKFKPANQDVTFYRYLGCSKSCGLRGVWYDALSQIVVGCLEGVNWDKVRNGYMTEALEVKTHNENIEASIHRCTKELEESSVLFKKFPSESLAQILHDKEEEIKRLKAEFKPQPEHTNDLITNDHKSALISKFLQNDLETTQLKRLSQGIREVFESIVAYSVSTTAIATVLTRASGEKLYFHLQKSARYGVRAKNHTVTFYRSDSDEKLSLQEWVENYVMPVQASEEYLGIKDLKRGFVEFGTLEESQTAKMRLSRSLCFWSHL